MNPWQAWIDKSSKEEDQEHQANIRAQEVGYTVCISRLWSIFSDLDSSSIIDWIPDDDGTPVGVKLLRHVAQASLDLDLVLGNDASVESRAGRIGKRIAWVASGRCQTTGRMV